MPAATAKQRKTLKCVSPLLVVCGTLKQEVDREEEEAGLLDNSNGSEDTAMCRVCGDSCRQDDKPRRGPSSPARTSPTPRNGSTSSPFQTDRDSSLTFCVGYEDSDMFLREGYKSIGLYT